MTNNLRVELKDGVARITMKRPEVHNAFNEDLIKGLHDAFVEISNSTDTRVVVLCGDGPSFCAGADLEWMRRASDLSEPANRADAWHLATMLRAVADCKHPVVSQVQGMAIGGGAGLVAATDIAIASESAQFAFSEVRLGLTPATVSPHVIDKIGAGRAAPLFLTGDRFSAAHAAAIGLIYRVVPDDELESAVEDVVQSVLLGGPKAQTAVKKLVRRVVVEPRTDVDRYTSELIGTVRASPEGREGVRAFLEKRKPSWSPKD
jgi:methylglutaconyl-CoA hydratase